MLFTIAFDSEIGYFGTYGQKDHAERIARIYRKNYPHHTYEVVQEDPEQAEYANRTNSIE